MQEKLLSLLSLNLHDKVIWGCKSSMLSWHSNKVMSHEANRVCLRNVHVDKMSAVVMGKEAKEKQYLKALYSSINNQKNIFLNVINCGGFNMHE